MGKCKLFFCTFWEKLVISVISVDVSVESVKCISTFGNFNFPTKLETSYKIGKKSQSPSWAALQKAEDSLVFWFWGPVENHFESIEGWQGKIMILQQIFKSLPESTSPWRLNSGTLRMKHYKSMFALYSVHWTMYSILWNFIGVLLNAGWYLKWSKTGAGWSDSSDLKISCHGWRSGLKVNSINTDKGQTAGKDWKKI